MSTNTTEQDEGATHNKVKWDGSLSLNTLVICFSLIAAAWGIVDKITASATVVTAALLIPSREGGVVLGEGDEAGEENGSCVSCIVVHG